MKIVKDLCTDGDGVEIYITGEKNIQIFVGKNNEGKGESVKVSRNRRQH